MTDVAFDADLFLISMDQGVTGTITAVGYVSNDSKGRFEDGCKICTSYIIRVSHEDDILYITTRNTTYRVVGLSDDIGKYGPVF